ncbi:allantoate amidohydrolase [Azospirillum halopraeferens]|uniref:allantoate amidohydrolase n=1 Tax=Azospirillum halopraeferens TaxID=34010 RepID=UPI000417AD7E|nr:allantoate amidohydrolase [Azospirillum halopraeferens]
MTGGDPIGRALMERLDAFAAFSEEAGALTRLYLTPAHRAAADRLAGWMSEAGMTVRLDGAGTVVGRYEGAEPGRPALLIGSHIDTVRNAGAYDGNLGVLAGVAAVAELHRAGERLPFAVEVLGFGDEEGVRFPVTLTGSRAVAGTADPAALDAVDADGISVREALRRFGCTGDLAAVARRRADVLAFLEVHIEQGPVLEAAGLPLGVVTAINGASRFALTVTGTAGHAGTVPMGLRRDALAAAAEMVLAVEARGAAEPDLVATVGRIAAVPGAVNVIPGAVRFTLDVRAPRDDARAAAAADILAACRAVAARRGVGFDAERTHDAPAVACAGPLIAALEAAAARAGVPPHRLPSGAGHDAMALAALCPVGMLFVRCAGGISHHPAEAITADDAGLAVRVLLDTIRHLDPSGLERT